MRDGWSDIEASASSGKAHQEGGALARALIALLAASGASMFGLAAGTAVTFAAVTALDPHDSNTGPWNSLLAPAVSILAFASGLALTRYFRIWPGWLLLSTLGACVFSAIGFSWAAATWDGLWSDDGGSWTCC